MPIPAPPDLAALIRTHGGYLAIPEDAWQRHEQALAAWKAKLATFNRASGHDDAALIAFPAPPSNSKRKCDHAGCDALAHFVYDIEGKLACFCVVHRLADCWADGRI